MKHADFPSWRWDPETKEGRVFDRAEDVPEGWLSRHPDHQADDTTTALTKPADPDKLTREEIVKALNDGGIEFKKNMGTAALEKLLRESVGAFVIGVEGSTLSQTEVDDMSTKALLALLPKE